MLKFTLIAVGTLAAGPLLATETAAPAGNKVTSNSQAICSQPGSRIRAAASDGRCVTTGRVSSYSREDIERTGQMDVAAALRLLDPRFF